MPETISLEIKGPVELFTLEELRALRTLYKRKWLEAQAHVASLLPGGRRHAEIRYTDCEALVSAKYWRDKAASELDLVDGMIEAKEKEAQCLKPSSE